MRRLFLSLGLAVLALTGCTGPVIMGSDAAAMYLTKPSSPPPADLEAQIPQHETWCYQTLGEAQCYAHPQDVSPERLINVDPQSRYPLDLHTYRNAVVEGQ